MDVEAMTFPVRQRQSRKEGTLRVIELTARPNDRRARLRIHVLIRAGDCMIMVADERDRPLSTCDCTVSVTQPGSAP